VSVLVLVIKGAVTFKRSDWLCQVMFRFSMTMPLMARP